LGQELRHRLAMPPVAAGGSLHRCRRGAAHGPQFAAQAVGHAMGVEGWTGGVVVDGGGHGGEGLTLFGCPHRSSGLAACQGSVWGWSRSDALLCVAAPLRDNPFCPIRAVGPAVRRLGDARLCEPPLNAGAGEIGVREGDSAGGSWRMRERPSFVRGRSTVIIVAIVARVWLVWNWLNMRGCSKWPGLC